MTRFWLGAMAALALVAPAASHEAPSGWKYDGWCCGGHDCAPIPPAEMTATGWRVRLTPGDHPMVTEPVDQIVPFGAARMSGDAEFHACIVLWDTGNVRCLYVPAGGMS